jgi:hypothetical protein
MKNYIREHTLGEVIRNAYGIYRHNFKNLFLVYSLPIVPFSFLANLAEKKIGLEVAFLAKIGEFLMMILVIPPITVAVSNICLGQKASLAHAYHLFVRNLKGFLITYGLLVLVFAVGIILLVVPGIVFMLWYMFVMQVVTLEGVYGTKALKRSKELGRRFYLRNFAINTVLGIIVFMTTVLVAALAGALIGMSVSLLLPHLVDHWAYDLLLAMLGTAIGLLMTPPYLVGGVLLYYDMRVRKEAYDVTALAEDLRW